LLFTIPILLKISHFIKFILLSSLRLLDILSQVCDKTSIKTTNLKLAFVILY